MVPSPHPPCEDLGRRKKEGKKKKMGRRKKRKKIFFSSVPRKEEKKKNPAAKEEESELDEYENCDVKHCDLLDHIVYVRSFFQCCGYASTMVRSH